MTDKEKLEKIENIIENSKKSSKYEQPSARILHLADSIEEIIHDSVPVLKYCPFCGGKAELNVYENANHLIYAVSCTKCGALARNSLDKNEAVNNWNRRN